MIRLASYAHSGRGADDKHSTIAIWKRHRVRAVASLEAWLGAELILCRINPRCLEVTSIVNTVSAWVCPQRAQQVDVTGYWRGLPRTDRIMLDGSIRRYPPSAVVGRTMFGRPD
jgi:hypothetical protein